MEEAKATKEGTGKRVGQVDPLLSDSMGSAITARSTDTGSVTAGQRTKRWRTKGTTDRKDKAKEERTEEKAAQDIKEDIKEEVKAEEDGTRKGQEKEAKREREAPTGLTHPSTTATTDSIVD